MNDKLERYNEKRNFAVTAEPRGTIKREEGHRFSVQHHLARNDHYDLRLELGGVALSWAVPKGPSFCTADKRLAMRVEDHPVDYMDFEGIIPKGEYGGGTVMLWDEGEWTPKANPEEGLEKGNLKFTLDGERLKGDWALVKIKSEQGEPWLLIKEKDAYAKSTAGIGRFTRGVRSGKSMAEIAKGGQCNPFSSARVMLARLCEKLPKGKEWVFEIKYDGHRVLGFVEGEKAVLKTRNGIDCTKSFKPAAKALEELFAGRAAVVDGEMAVAGDNGVSDFSALQSYIKRGGEGLCYVLFDLLALDGADLRSLPLSERKQRLKELIAAAPPVIKYSEHAAVLSAREIQALKSKGVEGIVAKRISSPYAEGKNGDWLKLKFRNESEFVIGGYKTGEGGLKSLLVGFYRGRDLVFAGSVGTGFSSSARSEILQRLKKIPSENAPFDKIPKALKGTMWVKPRLAAQVEYAELTSAGLLRQASFKGLREDKPAREIGLEPPVGAKYGLKRVKKATSLKTAAETKAGKKTSSSLPDDNKKGKKKAAPSYEKEESEKRGTALKSEDRAKAKVAGVIITHPEKVMFPKAGITKLELCEYYSAAAARMLPYIKDRFLSLVCCPSGIDGENFFRRHLDNPVAGVKGEAEGEKEEYFYVTGEKGLVALVQNNAVEFHARASKRGKGPDVMVFDLDPDEGLGLDDVLRGALDVKETLEGLGLKSFVKTSGGKGYHITVPFARAADPALFRDFSKRVAEFLAAKHPDRFTPSILKKERKGKIFVDWQRNSPAATSAAPYSVRAKSGAPVSFPISWEELGETAPRDITLSVALERLSAPDPWKDFFEVKKRQFLTFPPRGK